MVFNVTKDDIRVRKAVIDEDINKKYGTNIPAPQ
jgi:hypothetical protein